MGRKHFVLVHGAQHGAWCWFKTKVLLENAGHRVTAIDMTSAGISIVNADNVESFDHYNQPLYDVLASLVDSEKVIIVGHSYGGMSVARISETYADKILVAVYIAASMLTSGQTQNDVHGLVYKVHENDVRFNFAQGHVNFPTSCWVVDEAARRTYFGSCSLEDTQLGMLLLRTFPCMGGDDTTFTDKGYHSVPRVYIRTSLDKLLVPKFQDYYIARNPPKEVRTIEAGHAPFLSAPRSSTNIFWKLLPTMETDTAECKKRNP